MHLLGLHLARYIDWCAALSRKWRHWQVVLLEILTVLGFFVVIELAPGFVGVLYLFVIGLPVSVFGYLAQKEQRKTLVSAEKQAVQLKKTQGLLKGFKR